MSLHSPVNNKKTGTRTTLLPDSSFPRKRESRLLVPATPPLDTRFRGYDGVWTCAIAQSKLTPTSPFSKEPRRPGRKYFSRNKFRETHDLQVECYDAFG